VSLTALLEPSHQLQTVSLTALIEPSHQFSNFVTHRSYRAVTQVLDSLTHRSYGAVTVCHISFASEPLTWSGQLLPLCTRHSPSRVPSVTERHVQLSKQSAVRDRAPSGPPSATWPQSHLYLSATWLPRQCHLAPAPPVHQCHLAPVPVPPGSSATCTPVPPGSRASTTWHPRHLISQVPL